MHYPSVGRPERAYRYRILSMTAAIFTAIMLRQPSGSHRYTVKENQFFEQWEKDLNAVLINALKGIIKFLINS